MTASICNASRLREMISRRRMLIVFLLLLGGTLAVFWPVSRYEFVNFDDHIYVTENSHVQAGLTWEGVRWAFRTGLAGNWHPLTWLSHMLDVTLFGKSRCRDTRHIGSGLCGGGSFRGCGQDRPEGAGACEQRGKQSSGSGDRNATSRL